MSIDQSKLRILVLALLTMLVIVQAGLWFSPTGMRHLSSLEQTVEQQVELNKQQELKNQQLEAEVQNLREGLDAVEERARSELGLIGEEEVFYQILEKADASESESEPE